jgi:hypothetical protein
VRDVFLWRERRRRRCRLAAPAARSSWLPVALVALVVAACGGPSTDRGPVPAPGETRAFQGTWSASGSRRTLELERGHKSSIFSLTGSLLLTGEGGRTFGFRGDAIGLSDNIAGGTGQAVWIDERGDKLFSHLRGQPIGTGSHVVGTITGGTGRWAGVTGEYELRWQYLIDSDDGTFSGRAVGLKGRVTVPVAAIPRQ